MMKKLTALLLSVLMLVSLCACTGDGKYCVVKSLDELQYSIVLRNGDSSYHYINAALQELESDGRIDALAQDWFGDSDPVDFPSGNNRVKDFEYIEPREFTIGIDLDSFPMCFEENGVYTGFDVVLAQEVCDKLGWQLRVQPIRTEDVFVELNSGNIDCAWGGIAADLSSADYTILTTYMTTDAVIAGLSSGKGTLSGGVLYMSSAKTLQAILDANERSKNKLGQITRAQGTMQELFNSMANGDCDFVLTTEAAVYYNNHH